MTRRVQRSYKYRWYPTDQQAAELARTFGCVRLVYNKALEARTAAWHTGQRQLGYVGTSALLTGWKRTDELAFLNDVSSVPLQQALRHLQAAFAAFWKKSAGYPKFKAKKRSRASAEYTRSAFRYRDGQLNLAKLDRPLAIVWSRPLPPGSEPSTVTVSCDAAGRWFVSLLVEDAIAPLPPAIHTVTGEANMVGLDAGLTSLVTLSTGEKLANPRHERRDRKRLDKAQRDLARKQRGSKNRERARVKVARVHARISDRRRDHLHQLTTRLVRENQAVVIEDLHVRGMTANHTLARAISDAAWSELRRHLEYKCAWYGRDLVVVDRWLPSSKTCSACGRLAAAVPLVVRSWACQACGARHDRDVNAAKNILAAGLAVAACGAGVRPQRESPMGRPATNQETQRTTTGILRT
jgi:putative transposase